VAVITTTPIPGTVVRAVSPRIIPRIVVPGVPVPGTTVPGIPVPGVPSMIRGVVRITPSPVKREIPVGIVVIGVVETPDPFGIGKVVVHIIIVYDVSFPILAWYDQGVFSGRVEAFEVLSLYIGVPVGYLVGINVVVQGFCAVGIGSGFTDNQQVFIDGLIFCTYFREGFFRCHQRGIAWPVVEIVDVTTRHLNARSARCCDQGDDGSYDQIAFHNLSSFDFMI